MQMNVGKDESAAWPVANPVVTCASVSDAGFPSNFVADPFLYVQVVTISVKLDSFSVSVSVSLFFFNYDFYFIFLAEVCLFLVSCT